MILSINKTNGVRYSRAMTGALSLRVRWNDMLYRFVLVSLLGKVLSFSRISCSGKRKI